MQYPQMDNAYIPWIGTLCLECSQGATQTFFKSRMYAIPISYMPWVDTYCLNCPKDIA